MSQAEALKFIDTVEYEKGGEKRTKTISLDASDLLIISWFANFYPKMHKRIIDGKEYGWIKRSKVIEDLPILRISETSVGDRLKKLVHFGILDYKFVKKEGTYSFYTFGKNYMRLVETEGKGSTDYRVSGQPYTPLSGQPDTKDSKLNNISVKDSKRAFRKPTVQEIADYAKELGYPNFDAQYFYDYWESIGWKRGKTPIKDWKATLRNWLKRENPKKEKKETHCSAFDGVEEYFRKAPEMLDEVFGKAKS